MEKEEKWGFESRKKKEMELSGVEKEKELKKEVSVIIFYLFNLFLKKKKIILA